MAFSRRSWQINPVRKYCMSKKLRFGLPKGSLQDATIEKMAKAGFHITVSSRSYVPYVDDFDVRPFAGLAPTS